MAHCRFKQTPIQKISLFLESMSKNISQYPAGYFKNTCVTETGVSDFDKLTAVILKSHILKSPP